MDLCPRHRHWPCRSLSQTWVLAVWSLSQIDNINTTLSCYLPLLCKPCYSITAISCYDRYPFHTTEPIEPNQAKLYWASLFTHHSYWNGQCKERDLSQNSMVGVGTIGCVCVCGWHYSEYGYMLGMVMSTQTDIKTQSLTRDYIFFPPIL